MKHGAWLSVWRHCPSPLLFWSSCRSWHSHLTPSLSDRDMLAPFTFSGWVSRCSHAGLSGNRLRRELDHIVADGAVLERFLSFLGRRFGSSFQTSGFMEAMIRKRRIEASWSQTARSVAEVGTLGSEGSEESKVPRRSRGTLEPGAGQDP